MAKLLVIIFVIVMALDHVMPSYASNTNYARIRGYSSRNNDRLYNKIAIDLVNNRSNRVSVDDMVRIIKNYNIVSFDTKAPGAAHDMVIREIAYRMIKQNYLPRIGDQIKVFRQAHGFSKHVGLRPISTHGYNASLVLPVDYARIRENRKVDTLNWPEMSSQVSSAIESLWLDRIKSSSDNRESQQQNTYIVEVLAYLKSFSHHDADSKPEPVPDIMPGNILSDSIYYIFTSWQAEGIISASNLQPLAALLQQYIILNSFDDLNNLAMAIRSLKGLDGLREALLKSVYNISQNVKNNNPSDYATLAMLQAILNDISNNISAISIKADTSPVNTLNARN
jgi:hypothetical protein